MKKITRRHPRKSAVAVLSRIDGAKECKQALVSIALQFARSPYWATKLPGPELPFNRRPSAAQLLAHTLKTYDLPALEALWRLGNRGPDEPQPIRLVLIDRLKDLLRNPDLRIPHSALPQPRTKWKKPKW